jgi:hypothetical protein
VHGAKIVDALGIHGVAPLERKNPRRDGHSPSDRERGAFEQARADFEKAWQREGMAALKRSN